MNFDSYRSAFRNIAMEREDGILDVRLHTDGGSLKWGITPGAIHDQLAEAYYRIGRDPENRVMILRGSGKDYCTERNVDEYANVTDPESMYRLLREGRDILINTMEIEVPIISIVHGPATIHPEVPAMADIVLASPEASFQDSHIPSGIVPGDGGQIFWTSVLGPTRASYFFFSEQILSAKEALDLGVVHELHPIDGLLPRARELAKKLRGKSHFTLRYTRMAVHQAFKERLAKELSLGFTAETLAMASSGGLPTAKK